MDKLISWIKKELVLYMDFTMNRPYIRVGWIWILIAFFLFHNFSYIFWGVIAIVAIYNFINRHV